MTEHIASNITWSKIAFIYMFYCLIIASNSALSHSVNKTKNKGPQKTNSIIILGPKDGKNKDLQDFMGFSSGLNLSYFKKMTEAEKAILGLIATYAGTDCEPEVNSTKSGPVRYNCKLTLALGIGYQCSDEFLAFERKWFRNDTAILNELKECGIRPSGANYVTSFGEIILTKLPDGIKIYFQKNTFSMRGMESSEWTETLYFKVDTDQVNLIKRTHTKPKVENFSKEDF